MSVKAKTTVSIVPSPTSTRSCSSVSMPRLALRASAWSTVLGSFRQAESSCSIAASSSGVPWTFGPVNHLRAEASQ